MKATFITTLNHNVGDDFVREGIKYLLKNVTNKNIEFEYIHKHIPITVRKGFGFVKTLIWSNRLDSIIPYGFTYDKILNADVVIQSGAPVYWHHPPRNSCYNNEWYEPLIKKRFFLNKKAILLNIAAGSAQEYYSDGSEFLEDSKLKEYITEFYNLSKITTVRDTLAKKILSNFNLDAEKIPCSSLFANDEYNLNNAENNYVVLNYMSGGGHYDFGKNISKEKWEKTFCKIYKEIKKHHKVVLVCHNKNELELAKKIDNNIDTFYSNNFIDYIKFYSQAIAGITNRVHSSFMMAAFGKPSIVIGTDSRARMTEMIGLKNYFVEDVTADMIIEEFNLLLNKQSYYKEKLLEIKENTKTQYINVFKGLL